MPLEIKINYPDSFPDAIHLTRTEFEKEAKMAMAVKLFEMHRLSSGMAASLVGMDRGVNQRRCSNQAAFSSSVR